MPFLSTPSGWRATFAFRAVIYSLHHFYPRPPGGGRQLLAALLDCFVWNFYPRPPGGGRRRVHVARKRHGRISIHALRVEGDDERSSNGVGWNKFLSTPSGWRATADDTIFTHTVPISIHALRVEGDLNPLFPEGFDLHYFYPRPPGGGRPNTSSTVSPKSRFLSTPSGWRATRGVRDKRNGVCISIHALRVEGDMRAVAMKATTRLPP